MLLTWFLLVAVMLTAYVVLDGFDLGVGALWLFVAKTEDERRLLIRSIGPVWDGNEVWLIAAGGTLFFAFPALYASGFSGFYLPLMIVLWLLILRGLGLELRSHVDSPVWRGLLGGGFAGASLLLTIFFGAALGNVIRGVPLQPDGYFFLPLWTNWRPGPEPGVLDWYTVIAGALAACALALHGANYLALKTDGDVNARARRAALVLWPAVVALTLASLVATLAVRPSVLDNYTAHKLLYVIPAGVAASLIDMWYFARRGNERGAFAASALYLVCMLLGAAAAMYPTLLPSTTDPALDVTVYNAHSGEHALRVGLVWWTLGMAMAVAYTVFVYRSFHGKISLVDSGGH